MSGDTRSFAYESMGTHWRVMLRDVVDDATWQKMQESILQQSEEFDHTYSRFIKRSLVWELSIKTGVVEVPGDLVSMLRWYEKFNSCTDGKCNPLVGFALSDMGYDADYSLQPKREIRRVPAFRETVQIIDDTHIKLSEPVLIDVGGLGKGFFVDKIASFLRGQGYKQYLVDGSGDIFYQGDGTPICAGLEHPDDPAKVIGVIEVYGGSLCGSAGNRRKWDKYHHIIDPDSLTSPKDIIALWVLAESAVLADGLTTCLFFSDPDELRKQWKFEYCMLNSEYKVKRSPGFTAKLF